MSQELQSSGQYGILSLWGSSIHFDKKVVQLQEFSAFLEQRAKKSAADFLSIGIHKKTGWLIAGTDYLEAEMHRVCNEISSYITKNNLLSVPNWDMFLEPWIALADSSKQLTLSLHNTLIADCTNEVREQADQAYRNSLANSEGLGFGIISSSFTAHLIYAVQAASKEADNKRKAQYAADAVWKNSSPMAKADELTAKAYHETHEPFILDTLTNFYANIESFVYTGVGYDKKEVDDSIQKSVDILKNTGTEEQNRIIQSFQANICCGEAILYAIEKGLADDNFIAFCYSAPIMLLKKSIAHIIGWLSKEKHTNLLYNRPVFSEKALRFLSVVQRVFLDETAAKQELYNKILNGAFENEVNSTEVALYDLCYFNNGVLRKYANGGTHISVEDHTIAQFVILCNEIRCSKIVNMVKSAGLTLPIDAVQIKALIASKNSAIDKRHAEIVQAKREADEREAIAKAERERVEAERLARKQADEDARHKEAVRKAKRTVAILAPIIVLILVFALWLWPDVLQPAIKYNSAVTLLEQQKYNEAIEILDTLADYKDSSDLLMTAKYSNGQQLLQEKNYLEAITRFSELGSYKNSETFILEAKYQMALEKLSSGDDAGALELFIEARTYGDSEQYLSKYRFIPTATEDYLPGYGIYSERYNEKGLIISHIARSGDQYLYEYDNLDRLVSVSSDDVITEYFYNQNNQCTCERRTETEDILGMENTEVARVNFFEYNTDGNIAHEYACMDLGRVYIWEYEYDTNNNCISKNQYLFDGFMSIFDVDHKQYLDDEIKSQLQLMNREWQSEWQYNYVYNNGLVIEERRVHNYKHYGWERIDKEHITYQYKNGLLTQMTNHTYDNTYTYYYDAMGNLIREEDTDGGWKTYSYKAVFTGDRP